MVTPRDVLEARRRLASYIRPSPLVHSNHLSRRFGLDVYLKLESLQDTGSFKVRGALNRLLLLSGEERRLGVVAASAGNHAQGVAWAARQLSIPATIFMPRFAPIAKLLATRGYGAHVIQHGETYDECAQEAREWMKGHGGTLIPGFDDAHVIAGQGTAGMEILEQAPDAQTVIVPAGGGGLLAGVALAVKATRPDVEILGVQSVHAPAVARSMEAGRRISAPPQRTLADGIAVAAPGEIPWAILRERVDGIVTVDEPSIESAVITFLERKHLVVEGAGAAPLAVLIEGRVRLRGRRVVLVVSGGNLDLQWMDRLLQRGALALGRRMRLRIVLPDVPGALSRVTAVIAESGANILQVYHDRLAPEQPVHLSRVEFDLEILSHDHAAEIRRLLHEAGIDVVL
jgi:threonine dehydratase